MPIGKKKDRVPRVKTGRIVVTSGANKGKKYSSVAAAKKAAGTGSKISYQRVSQLNAAEKSVKKAKKAASNPNYAKRLAKRKANRMSGKTKVSKRVKSLKKR